MITRPINNNSKIKTIIYRYKYNKGCYNIPLQNYFRTHSFLTIKGLLDLNISLDKKIVILHYFYKFSLSDLNNITKRITINLLNDIKDHPDKDVLLYCIISYIGDINNDSYLNINRLKDDLCKALSQLNCMMCKMSLFSHLNFYQYLELYYKKTNPTRIDMIKEIILKYAYENMDSK